MNKTILFVTTGLGIGGAETLLLTIAAELKKRGFTIIVASLRSENPLTTRFRETGLEVIELSAQPNKSPHKALLKLVKIIRERNVDFVQGWMYHGNLAAYAASLIARLNPAEKTGFGIFGVWPEMSTYGFLTGTVARLGKVLSSRVKATVYNADVAAQDHQARGYSKARSLVIGNCIDIDHFKHDEALSKSIRAELGLASTDTVAIIAARNHPQKNWPEMLHALSQVEGLHVLAVGHKTQDLPDYPRLIKLGPREDMAALYSAADFFVLTSASGEGTSLAMSEAMSCSLPIIMTDIGDNARYIKNTGIVVKVGDVAALREGARKLTEDVDLRKEMSKQARVRAYDAFSTRQNVEPLVQIYANAITHGIKEK